MIAIAASSSAVVQVLDKAFMSGVLLMTAFWSAAAVTDHKRAPADKTPSTKATSSPAAVALGPTTAVAGPVATAAGPATTAVGQAATNPDAAVSARPHANAAAADGSMIAEHGSRGEQQNSSSLIAAELLDSMSYLQFCRMKLTAYNTLLKNVLTAVSTSAEVGWSECCPAATWHQVAAFALQERNALEQPARMCMGNYESSSSLSSSASSCCLSVFPLPNCTYYAFQTHSAHGITHMQHDPL